MHAKTWVEYWPSSFNRHLVAADNRAGGVGVSRFGKNHPVRIASIFTLFFMCTEGLIGAKLVLHNLVADNSSVSRAIYMAAHLVNTFVLWRHCC
jgi:heme A synthase